VSINENIDTFYDYFRRQLSSARSLERSIHRKIICVAIIDALARIRFPTAGNRERFVGVIDHCGAWEYADRISLQQLELALKAKGITNSALYQHVHREVLHWPESREITTKHEPTIDQLRAQVASADEEALVQRCRNPNKHRCHLHKGRPT
jgi:hypothetical protein